MIRRQVEGNETCCERSFLLEGALFWNFKRRSDDVDPTGRAMKIEGQVRRRDRARGS